MKKQILSEELIRMQRLAGIKPLYEEQSGTDSVYSIIMVFQTKFGVLLGIANRLLKNHEEGKDPSEYDRMIGGDVEKHPAWPTIKGTLQGKELFMFFLFVASKYQNIQYELPFGEDGDVERVINYYMEMISEEDFDANELASNFTREINVKELGSGDIKQDYDIILQLMTIGNGLNWPDIPLSRKEVYDLLKGGTLKSGSFNPGTSMATEQGVTKVNRDDVVDKYARSLGGLPLAEQVLKLVKKEINNRKNKNLNEYNVDYYVVYDKKTGKERERFQKPPNNRGLRDAENYIRRIENTPFFDVEVGQLGIRLDTESHSMEE